MKKIILFLSASLLLISVSSFAPMVKAEATSIDSSISTLSGDYSYVGTFTFDNLRGLSPTWEVYEASNSCGQYYAKVSGTYYKMFSCDVNGYNYYCSKDGTKYYTKI